MLHAVGRPVRRVAMLSLHTSPVEQPGSGDAGGMNVYVAELSRRLAARGIEVDVYTRATSSSAPPVHEVAPGVSVRSVVAGPFEGLAKADLPGQMCPFVREVLRTEATFPHGHYDLVHSHYWLSGQVGSVLAERWGVPLVHAMHTMAKVKNVSLAVGDAPEPQARVVGEEQVVAASDVLVANTADEARQLVELYDAPPERVRVVHPGVDLDVFGTARTGGRAAARRRLGLRADARVLLFVGRLQPLKAPDVLLRGVAALLQTRPDLRTGLVVPVVGGPSGSGADDPDALGKLAGRLGIADVVRMVAPARHDELASWYAAATLVCVPSYSESFGLVALEAQACGTPVVAAHVGGLSVAVGDGVSGALVDGHDPRTWADQLERLLDHPWLLDQMGQAAVRHAAGFSWDRTAEQTIQVYRAGTVLSPVAATPLALSS
ncbi:D-inositol-3-phosphate glycosyltransferase [soil metagenome]